MISYLDNRKSIGVWVKNSLRYYIFYILFSLLFFVHIFRTNLAEREPENIITTMNVQTMKKIIVITKKSTMPSYRLDHSPATVLKDCWIGKINKLSYPHPMIKTQSIYRCIRVES